MILPISPRLFLGFLCVFGLLHPPSLPAAEKPAKLLLVSVTYGFRHASIPASERAFAEIGEKSGLYTLDYLQQPQGQPAKPKPPVRAAGIDDAKWRETEEKYKQDLAHWGAANKEWEAKSREEFAQKMSPAALKKYDGVIFTSTTGDLPFPDPEGFLSWLRSGKAFIGAHAATDCCGHLESYVKMVNGNFAGHPWGANTLCWFVNHDVSHPVTAMWPQSFSMKDEIYQYKPGTFDPGAVRVLLSLDMDKTEPKMPYHVPVAWVREYGAGKVFYTNLGHNEGTWADPAFRSHLEAGIRFALGRAPANAAPNPDTQAAQYLKSFLVVAAAENVVDRASLEAKALKKAKEDPKWVEKLLKEWTGMRSEFAADTKKLKPEEAAAAKAKRKELIQKGIEELSK